MIEESYAERLRDEPLPGLRAVRKALREEERQVSYWRRLVQGRLDLVRAAISGSERPSAERLASPAAWGERAGDPRRSPAFARFADGRMERRLANLATLWDTPIPWDDHDALRETERSLVAIESELSTCRRQLHERIDACTAELVGRYRNDPTQLPTIDPR